ncbi:MAG: hypothetical protein Q8N42_00250 [bacterium]|nr:hypothetical protein [bacterium]
MKKRQLKNLKSVQEFKKSIDKTHVFIHGLESNIAATEAVLDFTKAKSSPDYKKFKKFLEFDDTKKAYLFELGFIALFANFEFFMSNFLKELFLKFPSSLKSEKILRLEEINDFEDIKEIKEYLADLVAIEKSYDIKSWLDCLNKKFNIKVFKTKKHLQRFLMLNSLRNAYMHAGSITNSKFRNEMKVFLKSKVPLNQKIGLDRKKYFEILYFELNFIIKNFEKV